MIGTWSTAAIGVLSSACPCPDLSVPVGRRGVSEVFLSFLENWPLLTPAHYEILLGSGDGEQATVQLGEVCCGRRGVCSASPNLGCLIWSTDTGASVRRGKDSCQQINEHSRTVARPAPGTSACSEVRTTIARVWDEARPVIRAPDRWGILALALARLDQSGHGRE